MSTAERRERTAAPAAGPTLRIRDLRSHAVRVPMRRPLGTSQGTIAAAPLVLVELETEEGVPGRAYLWAYNDTAAHVLRRLLSQMLDLVRGDEAAPAAVARKVAARFTLVGREGLPQMAMSALDCALWDARARAAGLPLVRLLGGEPRAVAAYNSNGLGIMDPEAVAQEAVELVAEGFQAIKLRLGYPTLAEDLAAARAVRTAVADDVLVMTDYNQALSVTEAIRRGRALDAEGLYWIEEPIRHDDYAGTAKVAREVATPIQIGENFVGTFQMAAAIAAGACEYVMPDLARIGGVTGFLRAAALAEAHGLPISSHLFPEVSVHLLALAPTAHYLEFVDWAAPLLREPLEVADGYASPSTRPGSGLDWDEDTVARYEVVV